MKGKILEAALRSQRRAAALDRARERRQARQPRKDHRCDWEEFPGYIQCRLCHRRLEIKRLTDIEG